MDYAYWDKEADEVRETDDITKAFPCAQERRIGGDEINGYYISTTFLGIDHGCQGIPLWFETMIFENGSWSELYMARYSTPQEAREGHAYAVSQIKLGLDPESIK